MFDKVLKYFWTDEKLKYGTENAHIEKQNLHAQIQ